MITGQTKTEGTYRITMLDSSSSLKDFAQNRKKYYKKYILNEEVDEDEPVTIDSVKHWWVRYEYIGPDNCPDDYDDPEPGDTMWMLKEQTKRPKGVVRKATVINYE
jgi:hypothetical protein